MYEFDALMGDRAYKVEVSANVAQVRTLDLVVFFAELKYEHLTSNFLFYFFDQIVLIKPFV